MRADYAARALSEALSLSAARGLALDVLAELRHVPDLTYADVRFVDEERELVRVRNSAVEAVTRRRTEGIGVRVLAAGGWGFASTSVMEPKALSATAERAVAIARASGRASVAKARWTKLKRQREEH